MKNKWKRYGKLGVAVVLLTAAGLFYGFTGRFSGTVRLGDEEQMVTMETMVPGLDERSRADYIDDAGQSVDLGSEQANPQIYYVHVCGEVRAPGVYGLPEGSRIFEAVEAAGGLTEEAWEAGLNQAQKIEDGMQLVIPNREEAAEQAKIQEELARGLVNINTASKEQLMMLPGIGESRAEAIIRYREESGGFQTIEEIMQVSGIKEAAYRKIKDSITI